MTDHLAFLILGLGNGAVFAALGLALVMTFKSSGVVNFATGAVASTPHTPTPFCGKGGNSSTPSPASRRPSTSDQMWESLSPC